MIRKMALAAALAVPPLAAGATTNQPVPQLDISRYSGTWHEIAHLPMYFQRKCVGDIVAKYTARADGRITVDNSCRMKDGGRQQSIGEARKVAGQPGALEVRFAPQWLSWLPAVWGDYWVIELDKDYRWAVVGGPSRKNLWVLSRTPTMSRTQFEALKADAKAKGYAVESLVMAAPLE